MAQEYAGRWATPSEAPLAGCDPTQVSQVAELNLALASHGHLS